MALASVAPQPERTPPALQAAPAERKGDHSGPLP